MVLPVYIYIFIYIYLYIYIVCVCVCVSLFGPSASSQIMTLGFISYECSASLGTFLAHLFLYLLPRAVYLSFFLCILLSLPLISADDCFASCLGCVSVSLILISHSFPLFFSALIYSLCLPSPPITLLPVY